MVLKGGAQTGEGDRGGGRGRGRGLDPRARLGSREGLSDSVVRGRPESVVVTVG